MTLGRLNHVGIATPSIEKTVETYRHLLGADAIGEPFDLPPQGVRVCFIDAPNTQIELIQPLDETSPSPISLRRTRRAGSIISVSRSPTFPPPSRSFRPRARPCWVSRASARMARRSSSSIRATWAGCWSN